MTYRAIVLLAVLAFVPVVRATGPDEATTPPVVHLYDAYFPRDRTNLTEEILALLDDAAIRMQGAPVTAQVTSPTSRASRVRSSVVVMVPLSSVLGWAPTVRSRLAAKRTNVAPTRRRYLIRHLAFREHRCGHVFAGYVSGRLTAGLDYLHHYEAGQTRRGGGPSLDTH